MKRKPMTWKDTFKLFGLLIMFGFTLIFYSIFYTAFFTSKRVIVDINYYGEANIECVLLVVSFIFIFYAFYCFLRSLLVRTNINQ